MLTQPNILAAYLYMRLGEQMPGAILDEEGNVDVAADNDLLTAWSEGHDPFKVDLRRLGRFIVCVEEMLLNLEELVLDPAEPAGAQYMTLVYDAAKETFDHDKTQLRTFFRWLYLVVFQFEDGPRWGDFIEVYGVENFVALVRQRFEELI
jgi:lysyl-tRNA synthetase class I